REFLAPRPVSILPGVGPAMLRKLQQAGLRTVGDLARAEPRDLVAWFGAYGLRLSDLAQGRDNRPVDPEQERKGISSETTFNQDLVHAADLEAQLGPLSEKVARQARAGGVAGRVVTLKLKTSDFRLISRRRALAAPTQTARTLYATARELLAPEANGRSFRLIGVGLAELVDGDAAVPDLFAGEERRTLTGERAVDALRARFGADAVVWGRAWRTIGRSGAD
ncbi:MAG: DNA polymerase IV, partial [Phenylobacterium sp.]|nr:DNA polymerase IV [Phenylobacterium sp.]